MQRIKSSGSIPYYGAAGIIDYVNDYLFEGEYILLAEDGTVKTNRKLQNLSLWVLLNKLIGEVLC